jgi:predicted anti-sigma-YlaC factor YlaD
MKDCTRMEIKIMALIDDELSSLERKAVEAHLNECDACRKRYEQLTKLKGVTQEMKFKKLPEMYWDEYWQHIYNRIERGISWIFISIGAIIILSFACWQWITHLLADSEIHPLLKAGIIILIVGGIILFISILREKIMVRKVDKYREVER